MLRSSRDPTSLKQSKISQIKVLWTTELGRVHPLPAIKDEFLHNLLSKERVCPVLPTSAFSNLKLLLQTRPLARSGGSQLGREAAKEAGRDMAFMCSDRMGVCVPSEGHNCTSHTHACTRVHTHTHSSANPASKAMAENSKHISSTSWVISAFNCLDGLLQEGGKKKPKPTLLSRIQLCKRHYASACIGNFTKLS